MSKSAGLSLSKSAVSIPSSTLPYATWSTKLPKQKSKKKLSSSLNLTKSFDVSTVESEYIRNLQQQIYFLELENDYLREQASKAAVTIPVATKYEAEKLMEKVRVMQEELSSKEAELNRRESKISILQHDHESTLSRLQDTEDSYTAEKRDLVNDVVQLRKSVEKFKSDVRQKDHEIETLNEDIENALIGTKAAEQKTQKLEEQLSSKIAELNQLRVSYEEKRNECVKSQAEFQELEDRFFRSKIKTKEETENSMKRELKRLRYDLREKELQLQQDRALRIKISDDCAALVKENAGLSSQVIDLQKQLDMEREYQEDEVNRKQANIQELVTLKEERQYFDREIDSLKEQLEMEQTKYKKLMEKFMNEEEHRTRAELQRCKLKAELEEVEGRGKMESEENCQLQRDNVILTDQVKDLKRKIHEQSANYEDLQLRYSELEAGFLDTKSKLRLQQKYDKIKWDEFDQMAEHMREFRKSMSPVRRSISNTSQRIVDIDE